MNYTIDYTVSQTEWDAFNKKIADKNPFETSFLQSTEWEDFVRESGKKAYSFSVRDENGEIFGVCLAVVVKAKRGKYLYVRHGPVIDWSAPEVLNIVINELKKIANAQKLWFVRVSPLIKKESDQEILLKKLGAKISPMSDVDGMDTWVMDISPDEDVIMSEIKKKTRYLIKQGTKQVNLRVSQDPADIKIFWEILQDTVKRQKWQSYTKEYIYKEFETFANRNNGFMVLAEFEGKYIAAGIFNVYLNQVFYHYGASLTEFQKIPGMYAVIWKALQEAKKRDCIAFNFWGIAPENRPNHPWVGLSSFKMKFPGFALRFAPAKDLPISPLYWLTNFYERLDKAKKGY